MRQVPDRASSCAKRISSRQRIVTRVLPSQERDAILAASTGPARRPRGTTRRAGAGASRSAVARLPAVYPDGPKRHGTRQHTATPNPRFLALDCDAAEQDGTPRYAAYGLENRWACKRPVGSNPTPAAASWIKSARLSHARPVNPRRCHVGLTHEMRPFARSCG